MNKEYAQLRERILCDYLDGLLDSKQIAELKSHISNYADLKQLFEEVKFIRPLSQVSRPMLPSEKVWGKIDAQLDVFDQTSPIGQAFYRLTWWKNLSIPQWKRFSVLSTFVIVIIMTVVFINNIQQKEIVQDNQLEYLMLLVNDNGQNNQSEVLTDLELFFL